MPEQRYPSANPSPLDFLKDFLRDIYRDILAAAMLLTRIPVKWPLKLHDGHVELSLIHI